MTAMLRMTAEQFAEFRKRTAVRIVDGQPVKPAATKRSAKPVRDTSREGRRVLKAEAARPDATRSASTEKPNPPSPPPAKAGKQTKADKATPGKRKTAPKGKKK